MSRTTSDRTWILDGDPWSEEEGEALYQSLAEAVGILRRVGGVVMIAADRQEVAPEMYITNRYIFKWSSYSPAQRLKDEPQESVDDQVPVEA